MNKTITANISGFIFNIEEDAYKLLVDYLEAIKGYFSSAEGGDEIIVDIESRIAELFSERLSDNKQVILKQDVEDVIDIMGRPEQYKEGFEEDDDTEGPTKAEEPDSAEYQTRHQNRKVFRDPDDRVLGGVCSGLSYYFGWDPIWIRLGFVLFALAGGAALLPYIILWIVMPEAKTTAEKLQMRGEPVTVDNIRKHVNDTMDSVKEGAKNFSADASDRASEAGKKVRDLGSQVGEGVGSAFGVLGTIIAKFVGVILILTGTGILIGSIIGLIAADHSIFALGFTWEEIDQLFFFDGGTITLGILALVLVLLSMIIGLFYSGLKLLLEFKTKMRGLGITLFCLFIIGSILGAIAAIKTARHMTHDSEIYEDFALDSLGTDTLVVNILDDPYFSNRICHDDDDFFDMIKIEDEDIVLGSLVEVHFITEEDDSTFRISVETESQGYSRTDATQRAEAVVHEFSVDSNVVNIAPYFTIPRDQKFTGQHVEIRIYVPEGKYVQMHENIGRVYWRCNYGGRLVQMEDDGWETIKK
jgi:phage shock protein PspC (stress-responsive transcriptional regulator)